MYVASQAEGALIQLFTHNIMGISIRRNRPFNSYSGYLTYDLSMYLVFQLSVTKYTEP